MDAFNAHTPNGNKMWHDLKDHLEKVAEQAAHFAAPFGGADVAHWLGLAHDVGKYSKAFQSYLLRCEQAKVAGEKGPLRGPDHSSAGAILARYLLQDADLAAIIAGHHGGIPSREGLDGRLLKRVEESTVLEALQQIPALLPEVTDARSAQLPDRIAAGTPHQKELFLRFLFSALVDADYLDTESHFQPQQSVARRHGERIEDLAERFMREYQQRFGNMQSNNVNKVRREVFEACRETANAPPGIFRLTVPTGGGKTLSSLAFALEHARRHVFERIIVAIPFTSIIDQTAQEFRKFLGPDVVLEHHSMVREVETEDQDLASVRLRLAAENWDLPIVVTTTVQLFDSLFSNRPARCRKLHRLARSVIILDEVQSLPGHYLSPILDVLQELSTNYSTTVVLCTATQPVYVTTDVRLDPEPQEIVPQYSDHFAALSRVTYEWDSRHWTWEEVGDVVADQEQVLVILNTRPDAQSVLDVVQDLDAVYHLSTDLCPLHRQVVLDEVRQRLKADKPCRLIATQVVEAGVDIDFPTVMRAIGPLPSMVQAAGRCNREGRPEKGRVILFQPADGRMPRGEYESATAVALQLLEQGANLEDPEIFTTYFRQYYMAISQDAHQIQVLRERLNYPEVASRFQLIPDDTQSVVVLYDPRAQEATLEDMSEVERLIQRSRWEGISRDLMRRLSGYMVNLYPHEFQEAQRKGQVAEVVPGLYVWQGDYDELRGVTGLGLDPTALMA